MCIHVCRVAAGPKANQECDPSISYLIFLKLNPAKIDNSCRASLLSSNSVISLVFYNGFWKAIIRKKCMEKLGSPLKFSSFQTQDTLTSRNSRCKIREFPQEKKIVLFSLKSQSASYYRVAILTHTLVLLFLLFPSVCQSTMPV